MLLLEAIGTRFWNPAFRALFVVLGLGGFLYWIAGIRRLHQVLAAVTGGTYPISPAHATLYHFVPGYNLYWIFRWPSEVARFVNAHSPQPVMPPAFPGFLILGFLVARILLDAALGRPPSSASWDISWARCARRSRGSTRSSRWGRNGGGRRPAGISPRPGRLVSPPSRRFRAAGTGPSSDRPAGGLNFLRSIEPYDRASSWLGRRRAGTGCRP